MGVVSCTVLQKNKIERSKPFPAGAQGGTGPRVGQKEKIKERLRKLEEIEKRKSEEVVGR